MNIKQLRAELRAWGRYWASKEELQGYASTSVTERCCEVMRTGVWISSDKHLFSHQSDSILPPEWVLVIDNAISNLSVYQKAVVAAVYIKRKKQNKIGLYHLLRSETALLEILSN
jgi:hypothetical protein